LPISSRVEAEQIRSIEATDDLGFVIEWLATYPFANALVQEDLGPLPSHLAQSTYLSDKERFQQLPLWTREAVGLGPYQLADWEPGSHLVLKAYDSFYGGRARIDTLTFRFMLNGDAIVAGMLAGSVDGALKRALSFEQAMTVLGSWEPAGRSPLVLVQPTHWRHIVVQFRDPKPPDARDVRFRRALLHALDRQALVETMLAGRSPVSDWFLTPDDDKYDWVRGVTATYDYSPRRSAELLSEVGWVRGQDGVFHEPRAEPSIVPLATTTSDKNVREIAIIADYWKAAGVPVEQRVIPPADGRDPRVTSTFPGFLGWAVPASFRNTLRRTYGPACPTEQTRWVGTNQGCYQNPELDGIVDALSIAIDPAEQRRLYEQRFRIETGELPELPLYFDVQVHLFRQGVRGVKGETNPATSVSWNVAEWDVR